MKVLRISFPRIPKVFGREQKWDDYKCEAKASHIILFPTGKLGINSFSIYNSLKNFSPNEASASLGKNIVSFCYWKLTFKKAKVTILSSAFFLSVRNFQLLIYRRKFHWKQVYHSHLFRSKLQYAVLLKVVH